MSKAGKGPGTLLIEWSPSEVRVVDPDGTALVTGASIKECDSGRLEGRDAIVAISQKSTFIRNISVPNASKSEIARALNIQIDQLLPMHSSSLVFGFRLGDESPGIGKPAVIGAVKAESIRTLYAEAAAAGLRIRAVVPLAFGSWLAARSHSLRDCAVVSCRGESLNVDMIRDGELKYSRSIPLPDSATAIDDEIGRTFGIAEVAAAPVVSAGCSGIHADQVDDKEPIQYLSDLKAINRLLFSLDLPANSGARVARSLRWKAARATVAALVAVGMGGFAFAQHMSHGTKTGDSAQNRAVRMARADLASVNESITRTETDNRILDVAFSPAQRFADVITVLAKTASPKTWFTGLSIGRGQPVVVNGLALSDAEVAKFIADISAESRFQEMKVLSATKATVGKSQVTQFQITGRLVGCLPFDRPVKRSKKK